MHIFFYNLLYFYFFKSFSFFQLNFENNFESNFGANLEYLFIFQGCPPKNDPCLRGEKDPKGGFQIEFEKTKVVQSYFLENSKD